MPRSRGLVDHTADRAIPKPDNQAAEAFGAVGELLGLTCRGEVDVQAGLRDINAKDMSPSSFPSCSCHASLDAQVTIQDTGKGGGDHTQARPQSAQIMTVRPPLPVRGIHASDW